ncbi:anthranilate phosphoribosyltransferase [Candidatus Bathyarchaeota archaeon]|nr:anthranilate phosphoribosyltransferase [Candidatus Bathyarchaeota archaeon]
MNENSNLKNAIKKLVIYKQQLNESEAYGAMKQIMEGNATHALIGAFVIALEISGVEVPQVKGFARCMRDFSIRITPSTSEPLVDTCGTGGDTFKTVNLSTLSALVTAAAGAPVAKHGNRGVTSPCGSADILEAAGVNLDIDPKETSKIIEEIDIGFLFAPRYHPAMKHAVIPRREIGLRTVFNILGPLTNPAGVRRQVIGVFEKDVAELLASVLVSLGSEEVFIIYNDLGADEILPAGTNHVIRYHRKCMEKMVLEPIDFGIQPVEARDIEQIESVPRNHHVFRSILQGGGPEPLKNAVAMNASLALVAGGVSKDFETGTEVAKHVLETGRARSKLQELVMKTGGSLARFDEFFQVN